MPRNTGRAFGFACAIAIIGGGIIGSVLGMSRFATEVADPIVGTIYSIPKITLYPIILLVFGLSPIGQGGIRRDSRDFSGHHFHHERARRTSRRSIAVPRGCCACREPRRSSPSWRRRLFRRFFPASASASRLHCSARCLRAVRLVVGGWLCADPRDGTAQCCRHFCACAPDLCVCRRDQRCPSPHRTQDVPAWLIQAVISKRVVSPRRFQGCAMDLDIHALGPIDFAVKRAASSFRWLVPPAAASRPCSIFSPASQPRRRVPSSATAQPLRAGYRMALASYFSRMRVLRG